MRNIFLSLILILGVHSKSAEAGLFEWEYFEPTAACVGAGAIGYSTASKGNEMKTAAIFCAVAGVAGLVIKSHYEYKFGEEFEPQERFLEDQIKKYNLLEQQKDEKKESLYFKRVRQILPPKVLPNGQGIGPRVKERLQLKEFGDRIGL